MIELQTLKKECDNYFKYDISKKNRKREKVKDRAIYYEVALSFKDKWNVSLQQIGETIQRDHATVLHYRRTRYLYENDKHFQFGVRHLKKRIRTLIKDLDIEPENPTEKLINYLSKTVDLLREKNRVLFNKAFKPHKSDISLDDMMADIPEDRVKAFKENQLRTFLLMEKSRETHQNLKA